MTFLSPGTALLAAAFAVPLLLLLYMLKLRRLPLRVPSTLLWRSAHQDLEANVPWQRLRPNVLFVLQAIAIALLIAALAQPRLAGDGGAGRRVVLLIDTSASMNARDGDADGATRLEAAKADAVEIVARLRPRARASEVMVIAFGRAPRVVCGFESRLDLVRDAIASIEPTDEEADFGRALELAGTFANRPDAAGGGGGAEIVLLSDGSLGSGPFQVSAGGFRFARAGPAPDDPARNLGIVGLSARRDGARPREVAVLARVANAATEGAEAVVTILQDERPVAIRRIDVPAAGATGLGTADIVVRAEVPGAAILRARIASDDALAQDDVAALFLAAPRRPGILLAHPPGGADPFLEDLLLALEPDDLRRAVVDPAETGLALEWDRAIDLVVLDRVVVEPWPSIPSLSFGAAPPALRAVEPTTEGGRRILSWDRQHPLLRYVSLDGVVFSGFGAFRPPRDAELLALGRDGPVIVELTVSGVPHVLVGFELTRSNWPLDPNVIVFLENVVARLGGAARGEEGTAHRPGDSITVRPAPGATRVGVVGMDDGSVAVAEPAREVTLPPVSRRGVYRLEGVEPPEDRLVLSVLSEMESDLRPRAGVEVNAATAGADRAAEVIPRELWPWLAVITFALLVGEWALYLRRASGR